MIKEFLFSKIWSWCVGLKYYDQIVSNNVGYQYGWFFGGSGTGKTRGITLPINVFPVPLQQKQNNHSLYYFFYSSKNEFKLWNLK